MCCQKQWFVVPFVRCVPFVLFVPSEELGFTLPTIARVPCASGTTALEPIIWLTILVIDGHEEAVTLGWDNSQILDDLMTLVKSLGYIFQLGKGLKLQKPLFNL